MRLNETLAEMTGLPKEFGELFYWISIFGEPSATEPWGFPVDGHHCNINCFALGEQMVLSPMLLGSEPVTAEAGVYQGVTVLREEEAAGWAFMDALTPKQRAKAVIGMDLPFDGYASGFKDNIAVPYDGLPVAAMTPAQRDQSCIDLPRSTPSGYRAHTPGFASTRCGSISTKPFSPGSAHSIRSARFITASTAR